MFKKLLVCVDLRLTCEVFSLVVAAFPDVINMSDVYYVESSLLFSCCVRADRNR